MKMIKKNIKDNIMLLISAIVFMWLNIQRIDYSFLISTTLFIVFFAVVPQSKLIQYNVNRKIKFFSMVSAEGTIIFVVKKFIVFNEWVFILIKDTLFTYLNVYVFYLIIYTVIVFLAFLASFSVYNFVLFTINKIYLVLDKELKKIKKKEKLMYLFIIIVILSFLIISYLNTNAFYCNGKWDIIYTSDSGLVFNHYNAYLNIYNRENNIKQPLFAYFGMPFIGMSHFIGSFFSQNTVIEPLLNQIIQYILFFASVFLLSRLLKLNCYERILFIIMTHLCYAPFLFILVQEQYLIVFFYLIVLIYNKIMEKNSTDYFFMVSASGTLVTSFFIELFNKANGLKQRIIRVLENGLIFVYCLLMCGRFDIFQDMINQFKEQMSYSKGIAFHNRFYQFTHFCSSFFVAPESVIKTNGEGWFSYQLANYNYEVVSVLGITILFIFFISFAFNIKDSLSRISFGWGVFAFILLCIIGYGSVENGMILYSLYFGWAFLVLLFKLLKRIKGWVRCKYLIPAVIWPICGILLFINTLGIMQLYKFCFEYYPM